MRALQHDGQPRLLSSSSEPSSSHCSLAAAFAVDTSAPKLTFRFGAADGTSITTTTEAGGAVTAAARAAGAATRVISRSQPAPIPPDQARLDGGTGAPKS